MKIGVISDTHKDRANALPWVIKELVCEHCVSAFIHCGDIEPRHLDPELFGNLPVICALNEEQVDKPPFDKIQLPGWQFTAPGNRIRDLSDGTRMYVGHKRWHEFLAGSERQITQTINDLRCTHDGLRWMFSGHTHRQGLFQTRLVNFINPGAIEDSLDNSHEFAVIDTQTNEIIFSRILRTKPTEKPFSIGIISDSLNISKMDPSFWEKLVRELKERDVGFLIHCGNIDPEDIGRPELSDLQVYYFIKWRQTRASAPLNWHQVSQEDLVVTINGYQFYIQSDLAASLLEESELDMHKHCLGLKQDYPGVCFVLYGRTNDCFLEEGHQTRILNPGDALKSRSFAVVCLPKTEITFGHVPLDPLPSI